MPISNVVRWSLLPMAAVVVVLMLLTWLVDASTGTPLSVADFDQGGLETAVLASFDAGGDTTLYATSDSPWGGSGTLVEGDVALDNDTNIIRVMVPNSDGSLLRLNDNGGLLLSEFFGQSGAGADLTVWVQTSAGTASFAANDMDKVGTNYVNFNVPVSERAILTGIGGGDRFLLALTRPVPNTAATGAPRITGTARVGETLTAGTSAIADAEGLTNVAYTYQWLADDADISGSTRSTYTLATAAEGKAIKVRVSFTDDGGNDETLTSAATAAVAAANTPATGAPTIGGIVQVGQTLTADVSGVTDADGLTNASFSYQWIRNDGTTDTDIQGATSSIHTLSDADQGKTIKVRVSFTDDAGHAETVTSTTTIIVDQPGTVSLWPELPRIGTVVKATLTDPVGLEGVGSGAAASLGAVSWQWTRSSEGSIWTSVDVYQDGDSYTPTEDDEGMWLKVTSVYTDGHGQGKSAEAITSATVGAREASPDLTITQLVTGLTHPWDIAFTPDGTMLFTERDDGLRVRLTDGTVRQVTADFSDLNFGGTAGLLALVLDPDFVSNRRFYTYQRHTGPEMQLIAWTIDQDYTAATRVADPLVGGIPVNRNRGPSHGGGRLRFGPQGYLWIATGDGFSGTAAQDLTSLGGKVLRVDSQTGAGAPGNPFAPAPVYTYGHRNPQGLALRPGTGQMWSVEHGPDHDDEINLLVSGGNYGWDPAPDEGVEGLYDETTTPMTDLVKFSDALPAKWSSGYPTLAVGGGVFLEGSQWREWEGQFAVATLKTKSVRVFKFTEEGDLVSQVVVPELDRTYGRLRSAVLGPDGALYITTTNGGGKDKILKVVPANTPATGAPTISGTAQVDETLTADISGITDADGLTSVSYSYQWIANDANTDTDIGGATSSTYTLSDADVGKTIKVRATFTDDAGNDEQLTSAATGAVAAEVVNPPLTASARNVPSSHDGSATFLFELRFSEEFPLSYVTLRDHAFTVTGGTVVGVRRLDRPGNIRWEISVSPDSNGDVTVVLPATTDCEAVGAICTEDGRRLSASTSAIVSGPAPVGTVPVAVIVSGTTPVAEGATVSFTISLNRAAPTALSVAVSVAGTGGVLSGIAPRSVAFATSDNSKTITLPTRDDNAIKTASTVTVSLATGSGYTLGTATSASVLVTDNDTAVWRVSAQPTEIAEGGSSAITLAVANGKTFAANQSVSLAVSGTASGSDYSLSATEVTLPAGASSVTATLTDRDDASVERDETVIVTATHDGQPIGSATVTIEDNDVAVWTVSAQPTEIAEGGSSTITLAVANGKTFAANQTVSLAVSGTASGSDYSLSATEVTLPAGASSATATLTARDDASVESDETVIVTATHDGQPIGSATVTIEANDVPLSNDATLSTLSFSGIDIGTFSSGTTDYSAIVEYDVASTTVTADPNDDGASVAVADANGVTYGTSRQVSLSTGDNEITVTVTAEDENAMKVYTVTVTRAEPDVAWGERLPDRDILLDSDAIPTGLWADDTNAWVISDCNVGEVSVYALSDGSKQDELSFTLAGWSGCATALWSNGATLWVADFFSNGVRAYRLSDGARQSDQDLDRDAMLAAGNTIPSGLWSNGEIMWVADHSAGKVFAYRLSDWARVSTREFDLTDDGGVPIRPFGLWSNGETLLASNWNGDRVLAFDLSDWQRQTSLDIDTSASGTRNSGIWSDGETLWIVDDLDKRIYAYAVQGLGSTR